ncbi:MAG: hypothetical protein ACI9NC_001746 [Verrucomicrobiales bacterium]|jgi:hypothetical protein
MRLQLVDLRFSSFTKSDTLRSVREINEQFSIEPVNEPLLSDRDGDGLALLLQRALGIDPDSVDFTNARLFDISVEENSELDLTFLTR